MVNNVESFILLCSNSRFDVFWNHLDFRLFVPRLKYVFFFQSSSIKISLVMFKDWTYSGAFLSNGSNKLFNLQIN